jgi:outer membrane protein assembly factor BamD (BamD/ComL family)
VILGPRVLGTLLFASAITAPLQCGSRVRPEHRMEEEPAAALYKLAERFGQKGDRAARLETLRFIVDRYPASRFAQTARIDLAPHPDPAPTPPSHPKRQ